MKVAVGEFVVPALRTDGAESSEGGVAWWGGKHYVVTGVCSAGLRPGSRQAISGSRGWEI
jgi:hypothetical protein